MSGWDGGPAFPRSRAEWEDSQVGMTLRDWFAGQALAGIIGTLVNVSTSSDLAVVAECCYEYADAMLAAREP